jgi:hypothetical protein
VSAPNASLALIVLGIALACLEAAVSLLGGHSELSRIARDLEDVIETEKRSLEGEAKA